mmetsp:Transcript_17214/g.39098  ORF Transcript_17214/g.39098 Transcript_17214/m.39098 type:complete len:125 (+) Transcript_17214:1432-1806(+)
MGLLSKSVWPKQIPVGLICLLLVGDTLLDMLSDETAERRGGREDQDSSSHTTDDAIFDEGGSRKEVSLVREPCDEMVDDESSTSQICEQYCSTLMSLLMRAFLIDLEGGSPLNIASGPSSSSTG